MSKSKMLSPDSVLQSAIQNHLAGRHLDASKQYRTYLRWRNNDPTASYNLSIILKKLGNIAEALEVLRNSHLANPGVPEVAIQLADLLSEGGEYVQSIQAYETAIALAPKDNDLYIRGAITGILANDFEAALSFSERALLAEPLNLTALLQKGKALRGLWRMEEAIELYDQVLARSPSVVEAWAMRAESKAQSGDAQGATDDYLKALTLDGSLPVLWNNYGQVLRQLTRKEEAASAFTTAITLKPDYGLAILNRAFIFSEVGMHAEAVKGLSLGSKLHPDFPNLKGSLHHFKMQICDWENYHSNIQEIRKGVSEGKQVDSPWLFFGHTTDPSLQLRVAEIYTARLTDGLFHVVKPIMPYRHKAIRIAYVSSDFRMHAVSHLISGLFSRHNRDKFEVFGYAIAPQTNDPMREFLRNKFDRFLEVHNYNDYELCTDIVKNEIDILIDLNGYTEYCRPGIFARRPAPIQVNFLGYAGTMGAAHMDYIIGDKWVIPHGMEKFYTESVVRMPDSYFVNNVDRPVEETNPTRSEVGLPENGFVFCCFNAFYKVTPHIFDVWMRLLAQVEGSVLWLKSASDLVKENLSREAEKRGISPDRLIYAAQENSQPKHLARHRLADLFLDTPVYNAHTTGADALWAGLPMITIAGEGFASRVGASLLDAVDLPELIAKDMAEYEDLALQLARSPDRLKAIRQKLIEGVKTSRLFDTDLFARNLEKGFEVMVARHEQGLSPAGFDIADT